MGDGRGCLRGDMCMYLHKSSKKGINIKSNQTHDDTKRETQNKQEVLIVKPSDDNVLTLKETINTKEKIIRQMEETKSQLSSENVALIEENGRFQRILRNMSKEMKLLKSQTQ